jgi:type IV secretory pathway TrbD component
MSTVENSLRRLPLRRSLLRPLLLAGGERALVLINCTLIAALIFGVGISTFTVASAILLATLGQWCLVQAAKADPDMTQVYRRHIIYKEFYPAQSSVHARPQIIHPSLPK